MPPASNSGVTANAKRALPPRPIPPKATLVRQGADFWRVFDLSPLTKDKPE